MSEQNNTSFAHAFLPGLVLGLIVGALAGAFLPDLMSGTRIKVDQPKASTMSPGERDARPVVEDENIVDQAVDQAEDAIDEAKDDAEKAAQELIDDAASALPESP